MKKIIIILNLLIISVISNAQIKLIFFNDVPPLHRKIISASFNIIFPEYLHDTLTSVEIKKMPNSFCKTTETYNLFRFLDEVHDTLNTISVTYRNISLGCDSNVVLGFTIGNKSIVSIYELGTFSRLLKVMIHECGHLYGLPHCPIKGCLMEAGGQKNTLQDIDEEDDFCMFCKMRLNNKLIF